MSARMLGRILLVPVWVVVAGLLGLVAARIVAFDERRFLLLADAYALWLLLPAYLVLAAAVCFRSRTMAVVAGVLVAAHLLWVLPPVFRAVERPAAATGAPRLRLVTANLMYDNSGVDPYLREVAAHDADVIILEEVTPDSWSRVRANGLLRSHPHHLSRPRWGAGGMAVLSNRPLTDRTVDETGDWPVPSATVEVSGLAVRVIGVHVAAPHSSFAKHQAQQQVVNRIVRDAPRPRLVAGDFNATPYNRWYGELRDLGLGEVHDLIGDPFATTWPNGQKLLPPVRIDHVFVDRAVVPLRVFQGTGTGSDHRPVIVDLAVLPRP